MAALARDRAAAVEYARRAVALRPEDASGHGTLGVSLLASGRPEEAAEALRWAIELAPAAPEHRHNLARAYLALHRHDLAIPLLREAIALAPRDPQNYLLLASTYGLFGMAGPAIECLSEGLRHRPDHAPLHTAAAGAFASLRNDVAAERHHRRAVELSPEGRKGLGNWLVNQGRFAEADAIFEAMIREGQDPAFAYYGLMLGRRNADDGLIAEMSSLLDRGLPPRSEMFLRYALGKAEEGRGRYGEAMGHYDAANRLAHRVHQGGRRVSAERFAREGEEARRLFKSLSPSPDASQEAPIFIVGMIRSGTTLLDQIVSSHPLVASGGELRFWLEEARLLSLRIPVVAGCSRAHVADAMRPRDPEGVQDDSWGSKTPGGATLEAPTPEGSHLPRALADEYVAYARLLARTEGRFTDKMPLNFEHLGLIHRALPNARFLHIRRHPVDTALSIWTTFFGQGPLFAYDKASIVAYYREYQKAMAYSREALPADRLLELDYETLTSDPEPTIRRVIEFCGLPWDDACLHHDQNASAIHTPSRWQARQPIYRTSVERWRHYGPWLGELRQLLD